MSSHRNAGFTLLECMIALLLLATSAVILVQAQTAAVNMQEDASRLGVATMLGRQLMTDLELFMEQEGFGEMEVRDLAAIDRLAIVLGGEGEEDKAEFAALCQREGEQEVL